MKLFNLSTTLIASVALAGCASSTDAPVETAASAPAAAMAKSNTIVDVAMSAGSFTTLLTALKAAGLDEVLAGEGPFTVFAPSDQAFAKLDGDALEDLLADKAKLTKVLTYHVLPGTVSSAEVRDLSSAKTVNGAGLSAEETDGKVTVGGANIVMKDLKADNGIIHVIDTVLMPSM